MMRRMMPRWRRVHGNAGPGPAAALAVVTLAGVFTGTGGPLALAQLQNHAWAQELAGAPAITRSVTATATWDTAATGRVPLRSQQIVAMGSVLGTALHPPLAAPGAGRWAGLTTPQLPVTNPAPGTVVDTPPQVEAVYQDVLGSHARLAAGHFPEAARRAPAGGGQAPATILDVAVTQATAARLQLATGSELRLAPFIPGDDAVVLRVTGIVRPADPAAAFWNDDPTLAAPQLTEIAPHQHAWVATAFIGGGELPSAEAAYAGAELRLGWGFPLSLRHVSASQASATLAALHSAEGSDAGDQARNAAGAQFVNLPTLGGNLDSLIATFLAQQAAAGAVLSLLAVGLAAVALIAAGLTARLVADRHRAELTLRRARGASVRQLGTWMLGRCMISAGPAILAGAGSAVLAFGRGAGSSADATAWALGGAIAAAALLSPPVLAGTGHRMARYQAGGRADLVSPPRRPARRLVTDAGVVAVAAGAMIVLRDRGLQPQAGIDPYTAAAPVLAGAAAALIVARAYPAPLRLLLRLVTARRGPTGFLGLARAARSPSSTMLPALILALALTVAGTAGMIAAAVGHGQAATSWQRVGADAAIEAGAVPVGAHAAQVIAGVPGVKHTADVYVATADAPGAGNLISGGPGNSLPVGVVAVKWGQYAALAAGTPWPAPSQMSELRPQAGGTVPAVASPDVMKAAGPGIHRLAVASGLLNVRFVAATARTPALPGGGPFVIIPWQAVSRLAARPQPNLVLVTGPGLSASALRAAARAVPGAQVLVRAEVLASLAGSPLQHQAAIAYAAAFSAAAVFCAIAVLLSVMLEARTVAADAARLAAIGMRASQARALSLLNQLPVALVGALGGALAALVLAPLIGPAIDLSSFTGSVAPMPVRPDPPTLLIVFGGLAILIGMVLAVQDVISGRSSAVTAILAGDAAP